MDWVWAITIAANCFLLFLLVRGCYYLDFFFLTILISFNTLTAPIIWVVYQRYPSYYPFVYNSLPWIRGVLWFGVCYESYLVRQKKIAVPVEAYAAITLFALVASHAGFIQCAYWVNQWMRIFNIAVVLAWINMFYTKKEPYYV